MSVAAVAFITPSYAGDFERCRLLCQSLDLMARSSFDHFILVADHDLDLFRPLAGGRRMVVPESELLPHWLKAVKRPFGGGRYTWGSISPPVWPMSGWHVQQLRKMLIARHIANDVLVMADSDSLFVRPFSNDVFVRETGTRLYVMAAGIDASERYAEHRTWCTNAAEVLHRHKPTFPAEDYINNLVSWRRDHALAMLEWIEEKNGRDVVAALGRQRTFSEYQIYGAFVTEVLGRAGHVSTGQPLSHTYWSGEALSAATLESFVDGLHPDQIAIGIQSFTGTPIDLLKSYLGDRARAL
jgi:hypothetical protein